MAIPSPLKSRRLRTQKGETTQQVVVFQLQREWFALPIFAVKKVVPRSETHGDYQGTGLTVYDGKELLVLDIQQQIFGDGHGQESLPKLTAAPGEDSQTEPLPLAPSMETPQESKGYLLIIRNQKGDLVGLPVDHPPAVRRVPQSAMVPLPPNYAARVNMRCVSGLIVQENQPILFSLNPDLLLPSQPLLSPMV